MYLNIVLKNILFFFKSSLTCFASGATNDGVVVSAITIIRRGNWFHSL